MQYNTNTGTRRLQAQDKASLERGNRTGVPEGWHSLVSFLLTYIILYYITRSYINKIINGWWKKITIFYEIKVIIIRWWWWCLYFTILTRLTNRVILLKYQFTETTNLLHKSKNCGTTVDITPYTGRLIWS